MLARGLEQLLSFDGDVADTFERSFQIEYKTPSGQTTLIDLCEDGANIRVDHINRKGKIMIKDRRRR